MGTWRTRISLDPGASERTAWATEVAGKVGKLLMGSFRTGVQAERKAKGVLTALDKEAESLILAELKGAFPGDGVRSEEGAAVEGSSGWHWMADPLDGTTNYVCGLPFFGVSLACMRSEELAVGVIHAPAMGETFTVTSEGAWGPEGPMYFSGTAELADAVLLVNKAYHPAAALWEVAGELLKRVRAFRMHGCVSLDLAYVAAGRVDGVVLLPADPWDVAAGMAMMTASGVTVANFSVGGASEARRSSGIVAAGPVLIDQMLALLPS